jgi:integrase
MEIKLDNVNTVRKRISNGTIKTYHYHRITGKRIEGEPGTAAFFASYEAAAKAGEKANKKVTIGTLADTYFNSADFLKLAYNTRLNRGIVYNAFIRSEWENAPLEVFADRRIRGDVLRWRDAIAAKSPSTADSALMILRVIIAAAVDRGLLSENHLQRMTSVYRVDRSERIWERAHIEKLFAVASPELQWLVQMALLTLQREGDLFKLEWSAIQNGRLVLHRQEKTKAAVSIAVEGPLRALLATIPRRAETILTTVTGRPWTIGPFRKGWSRTLERAGLKDADLHFHDLRGTGATLIANAGRPFHEIAAMTGHSLQGLTRILPKYVSLNTTHANNAQEALNASWVGGLQTKLQTEGKNP